MLSAAKTIYSLYFHALAALFALRQKVTGWFSNACGFFSKNSGVRSGILLSWRAAPPSHIATPICFFVFFHL